MGKLLWMRIFHETIAFQNGSGVSLYLHVSQVCDSQYLRPAINICHIFKPKNFNFCFVPMLRVGISFTKWRGNNANGFPINSNKKSSNHLVNVFPFRSTKFYLFLVSRWLSFRLFPWKITSLLVLKVKIQKFLEYLLAWCIPVRGKFKCETAKKTFFQWFLILLIASKLTN